MATITVRALWSRVLVDQSQRQSATISVRVPGPNLISPSTATTGLTALHLVGISSDGTHVVDVDPATLIATGAVSSVNGKTGAVVLTAASVGADAAGTAATSMAAHLVDGNPHPQYALDTDLAGYSVVGHTHAASAIVSGTLSDARLSSNVPLLNVATNAFTGTVSTPKVSVPALITGLTNPFIIRSNTGGTFTEPSHYIGIQGSETTGLAFRSNGQVQFMGQVSVGQFNDIQLGGSGTPFGFTRGSAQNFQLGGVADITADAGTGTSVSIGASATTSTTAKQGIWKQFCSWLVNTQATRLGQIEEFVASYTGWQRSRRVYSDGARAYTALTVHTTAPADADLQASETALYTDGSALFAKLKNASSTVYTIPLAGSGSSGGATFSGPINYPAASPTGFWIHCRDFGGKADGVTDDLAAINAALASANGSEVRLPAGDILVSSTITLPNFVSLIGSNVGPTSHSGYRDGSPLPTTGGTRILTTQTSQSVGRTSHGAYFVGMCFYYPNQTQTTSSVVVYPPTILVRGNNSGVINCEFLNSYIAIDINNTDGTNAGLTQRPLIRGVTGQPLYRGIRMGTANENAGGSYTGVLDCPRIEDVHWNPWWSYPQAGTAIPSTLFDWMQSNAIGFEIGDVDEFYFRDCFMFGYGTGLWLKSINRGSYGSFLGGGFDTCPRCVLSDATQYPGVTFSGTSFGQPSSTTFGSLNVNGGVILVNGGRFFNQTPCVVVTNGTAALTGCNFGNAGTHVTRSGGSVNVAGGMAKGGLTTTGTVSSTGVMSY